ncbi:MAG TPA: hypothetical protein VM865_09570 [Acidobacteriaceae bacterium]|nr:hypothetical protein [Acidobacteriaceae bacterium]
MARVHLEVGAGQARACGTRVVDAGISPPRPGIAEPSVEMTVWVVWEADPPPLAKNGN